MISQNEYTYFGYKLIQKPELLQLIVKGVEIFSIIF